MNFAYKVAYVDKKLTKSVVLYNRKNAVNKFIKAVLKEYQYCQKVIKKDFNKNLVMSAEDEERFQSSNKCSVCNKLYDVGDYKITTAI